MTLSSDEASFPLTSPTTLRSLQFSKVRAPLTPRECVQEALKVIMRELTKLHNEHGLDFLLATQAKGEENLKVLHSKLVNGNQRQQIIEVIQDEHAFTALTPAPGSNEAHEDDCGSYKMVPVFNDTKDIVISRGKNGQKKLHQHLYDLFTSLSQTNCKSIAKEWIKAVEPKKQASYPYKLGNSSKPVWWPRDVEHVEPDHLNKENRTALLILLAMNPDLDLDRFKERTDFLLSQKPFLLKRIVDEIYYFAFYSRLLYGAGEKEKEDYYKYLCSKVSLHELHLLHGPSIKLIGSNFSSSGRFTLVNSEIDTDSINKTAFQLESGSSKCKKPIKKDLKRKLGDFVQVEKINEAYYEQREDSEDEYVPFSKRQKQNRYDDYSSDSVIVSDDEKLLSPLYEYSQNSSSYLHYKAGSSNSAAFFSDDPSDDMDDSFEEEFDITSKPTQGLTL
ncbi:hypothetical protein QCA50_012053 [Cerrena zonata]|uniref:Subtelomeric hrmA-associated cluster protein AFUB-079030/YDR124W-like helical bundle domain-containing protein n=1 Tax=Cerrena zonata TaxID=2478898 RepID=A0AAW0FU36_9APHY